jgi:DNA repair protein RadC
MKAPRIKTIYLDQVPAKDRIRIKCSRDAYVAFKDHWDLERIGLLESGYIMLLTSNLRVLGIEKIAEGGASSCLFDRLRILRTVLSTGATSFILAHNHPSGATEPSRADIEITRMLVKAAKTVGLELYDHIILTPNDGYLSMSDENMISYE